MIIPLSLTFDTRYIIILYRVGEHMRSELSHVVFLVLEGIEGSMQSFQATQPSWLAQPGVKQCWYVRKRYLPFRIPLKQRAPRTCPACPTLQPIRRKVFKRLVERCQPFYFITRMSASHVRGTAPPKKKRKKKGKESLACPSTPHSPGLMSH